MSRIPLWVDLSAAPPEIHGSLRRAAEAVKAEHVLTEGSDVLRITIQNAADQQAAADAPGVVVVDGGDWTIIPLENLIASRRDRPDTLFAVARSSEEAARFRHTLDVGVHGIVLATDDPHVIEATHLALVEAGPRPVDDPHGVSSGSMGLGTITAITDAGMAERVCIDCTERFQDGEGVLVGSTARSFVLVHAETLASEYVRARPFRVNAGAVHSYVLAADGGTRYLSELEAGTRITAVHRDGASRTLTVGRAKIEHRPHTLIRWSSDHGEGSAVLQTAETVRLIGADGTPIAITDLQESDRVWVQDHTAARHFGMPVQERLVER